MQRIRRRLFSALAAPIIAAGGFGIGVTSQACDRNYVRASIELVADVGAAHIMRREGFDLGVRATRLANAVNRLVGQTFVQIAR